MSQAKLLLIEDDLVIAKSVQRVLEEEGYAVEHEANGQDGLRLALSGAYDLVITDFVVPGLNGVELVKALARERPQLPAILVSAHGDADLAIEATKSGAYDCLLKPFPIETLLELVEKAVSSSQSTAQLVTLGEASASGASLIGRSAGMQALYRQIGRMASRAVNVLILGETGTGKELVAQAMYQHSERRERPFIAVNCAAIPEALLESELFGHEKGAFTGAVTRRIGRFEQASGGTLFLDEIGELTLSTQAKLLRVLQERTFERVGGNETLRADCRVLAATHRDLRGRVSEGTFREDLYYRLSDVVLQIPPLRERREDIALLVTHFAHRIRDELRCTVPAFTEAAMRVLQEAPWPGNVRQLEKTLRTLILDCRGFAVDEGAVKAALALTSGALSGASSESQNEGIEAFIEETLKEALQRDSRNAFATVQARFERETLMQAMKLSGGNLAQAARLLGLARMTLRGRLRAYGLRDASENETE